MLDSLEKISKIVFAGIASTVIAIAGLNIEWRKLGIEEDSWCFEHANRVQAAALRRTETIPELLVKRYAERCKVTFAEAARVLNDDKVIAELSVNRESRTEGYGRGSSYGGDGSGDGGGDNDSSGESVPGDGDPTGTGGDGSGGGGGGGGDNDPGGGSGPSGESSIEGFVALGRTLPTSYAQVNFDNAANGVPSIVNGSPPTSGAILKARWSVNLRSNTTITTGGRNPILAVIGEGECITVSGEPQALRGQFWAAINRTECPE